MGEPSAHDPALLVPYLPRVAVDWLTTDPERRHRAMDGSFTFVDVSGFTALSERLADLGKRGAEELTNAIEGCFTELLAVAYELDGSLIKFGGDALLLFFRGEGHERRAVAAAAGMRKRLREVGRIETPGGRVTLRMSVGVHSGRFHFFLVGSSHRELIVTGPAASRTVTMEGTADASEIVVSPETAEHLPAGSIGEPKGEGFLLKRSPSAPLGDPAAAVKQRDPAILEGIPVATREHVLSGLHDAEHRRVVVSFLHYDGTDHMIETEGPEAVAERLHGLVSATQAAADRHGVTFLSTDVDHDGGKIILAGGAPRISERDEEAVLKTVREIVDGQDFLPIRIGVHRGHVFAGDIGPPYRRTYTIMGDAVNLSARLMAAADPGSILATDDVLTRSRTRFETEALEPFYVKGKSKPVQAYRVLASLGEREGGEEAPLVGREDEVEALRSALTDARAGRGRVVEIVGGAGVGKTRLVREIVEEAEDLPLLAATCDLYERTRPYYPFRILLREALSIPEDAAADAAGDLLTKLVSDRAPDLAPWTPLLGDALEAEVPPTEEVESLDERFRRERLAQTVGDLLEALATGPFVVAIEDAQWMDEASAALLTALVERAGGEPWFFVVTRQPEGDGFEAPDERHVTVLEPGPLDPEESARLVALETEDAPLAPHDIEILARRSGGNPLFLRELIAAARESGGVDELPDSVEVLIAERLDRLSPSERGILRRAAVLGPGFDEELLRAVLPPQLQDALDWGRLSEFLDQYEPGHYRFRHKLIRDAVYEGLRYGLRREIHGRAGEAIERAADDPEEVAGTLSLHFLRSGSHGKAWRYARLGGERARGIYANVEAETLYERALEAAQRLQDLPSDQVARTSEALGDVRNRMGRYAEAGSAYRTARRMFAGHSVDEARLMLKESWIPERSGRYSQALRWITRGLGAIEWVETPEAAAQRAQLMVWKASVRQAQARHREAIRWCERAIEQARIGGDRDAEAHAYYILDWAYVEMGSPDEAVYSPRALEIYEEIGDLAQQSAVLNNMGVMAYFDGRWDEALEHYRKGRDVARRTGDEVNAAFGTMNIGEILSDQGRLDEAETHFREALQIYRAANYRSGIAYALGNLGRIAARAGRHDEALDLLRSARDTFSHIGEEGMVSEVDARIAETYLFSGDPGCAGLAEVTLREAEAAGPVAPQVPMLHRVLGYTRLRVGDHAGARASFEESAEAARQRGMSHELALTLMALQRLERLSGGSPEPAIADEAASISRELGLRSVPLVTVEG